MVVFAGDRWPEWAGTSSANSFFINVLHNLGKLTGELEPSFCLVSVDDIIVLLIREATGRSCWCELGRPYHIE